MLRPQCIFFISYAGTDDVHIARGCQVVILSRFDGDSIDPEQDAIVVGCDESCSIPAQTLFFFSSTGHGVSGLHYGRVFPPGRNGRQTRTSGRA